MEKNQTNAASVTLYPPGQAISGKFGKSNLCDFASSLDGNFLCSKFGDTLETNSGEMSKKNAISVALHPLGQPI